MHQPRLAFRTWSLGLLTLAAAAAIVPSPRTTEAQTILAFCTPAGLAASINLANANGEDDTIVLEDSCTISFAVADNNDLGPRALPTILPDGGHSLTINGNGATLIAGNAMGLVSVSLGSSVVLNDLTIDGFSGGSGGAITSSGTLEINRSTFNNNVAEEDGGAIYNQQGTLTIDRSTFYNNEATNDDGGAIWSNGTTTVTASTFESNDAGNSGGAIIQPSGTLGVTNSTFVGNTSNNNTDDDGSEIGNGAAIRGGVFVSVLHATFLGNTGLTIVDTTLTSEFYVANSLFAGNTGIECSSFVSPVVDNVDSDGSCGAALTTAAPVFGLSDNGGPTRTVALTPGHPAIDLADLLCEPVDQRGITRSTPNCDAGAFEVGPLPPPDVTVTGVSEGATYTYGSVPVAGCLTEDAGGGIGTHAQPSMGGTLTQPIAACSGATNLSGVVAPAVFVTYNVTFPLPIVTVTGVVEGGIYIANAVPTPGCLTVDGGGGVLTIATLTEAPHPVARIATCSGATNLAGNPQLPASVSYTVLYPTPTVEVTGVEDGATYTFGSVPKPGCKTTDTGGGIGAQAQLSLSTTSASGEITATCSGALNSLGILAVPASVTYTVECLPIDIYAGQVRVKQNATTIGNRDVLVSLTTNPATCDVTGVNILPDLPTLAGALSVDTAIGWKAAIKLAVNQWKFTMQTPSAAAASVRINNAPRVLDASTILTVKLAADRQSLYLKLTGKAPTGVGITKVGIEIETLGIGLTPATK